MTALPRSRLGRLAFCAVLVGACSPPSRERRAEPPRLDPPAGAQVSAAEHVPASATQLATGSQPRLAAPKPAAARSVQLRLVSAPAGTAFADAETIKGVGRRIETSASSPPVLLDLPDGTRLSLGPSTELWAFAHAKSLLLVSGQVRATRLPDAPRAGVAPARIATLAGAAEISPGADLWLRADARSPRRARGAGDQVLLYRVQLALLRGALSWFQPDGDQALQRTQLSTGEPLPPSVGTLRLLTLRAGSSAQAKRDRVFRAQPPSAASLALDEALAAALEEQQALRDRGDALLAPLRTERSEGLPVASEASVEASATLSSSTRAYQRLLVEHARRRQAQEQVLLLAAERSLLRVLGLCAVAQSDACPAATAWSARFAEPLSELL